MKKVIRSIIRQSDTIRKAVKEVQFRFAGRKETLKWRRLLSASDNDIEVESAPKSRWVIGGWYGTETCGDKFILLGWLRVLFTLDSIRPVEILSMEPKTTEESLKEITTFLANGGSNSRNLLSYINDQVKVYPEDRLASIVASDVFILGGGPIMDDPILSKWLVWFEYLKNIKAISIIGGNGLGPLKRRDSREIVFKIMNLSSLVLIRNSPKFEIPQEILNRFRLVLDPAFLCYDLLKTFSRKKKHIIALNTRSIPFEYAPSRRGGDEQIIKNVLNYLSQIHRPDGSVYDGVVPFSTHERDTVTDLALTNKVLDRFHDSYPMIRRIPALDESMYGVISTLSEAELVISTRFHGFILGLLMECKTIGFDYDEDGGKTKIFYQTWVGIAKSPSCLEESIFSQDDIVSLNENSVLLEKVEVLLSLYVDALKQTCR